MKTQILYLLLFVTTMAGAQTVNIPDANFKAALLLASTTVDIAKDSVGQNIAIDSNGDGEIQESEALLVYQLTVANQSIAGMDGIEAFTNLTSLRCNLNQLTALDVSECTNLTELYCSYNSLTTLDVTTLVNLQVLYVSYNNLTQLNISACPALTTFSCSANNITTLNFTANPLLDLLFCDGNQLASLDLAPLNLSFLSAGNNLFTTLDLSTQSNLRTLNLFNSTNLASLYIKNGSVQNLDVETFYNCSALSFVCTDENEIDAAYSALSQSPGVNLGSLQLTSFCTFTPGGNYNTIAGTLTFDYNNNGCDGTDDTQNHIKVKLYDGTNTAYAFTNSQGQYMFYTQAGTFNVSPQFEDDLYFIASPVMASVNFPAVDNAVATENFCITADGVHADVEVVMVPIGNARPGFDADYKIVFKNKGNQTLSGAVSCVWDSDVLEPVSFTPMPNYAAPGTYSWNYSDLQPFENREVLMTLNVNSPTDSPAVNDGDILPFTALITSTGNDQTPQDNEYTLSQRVLNSYDPNNIICIEGDTQPTNQIGEYLHYVVNFENIGTAAADFVVITQEIDPTEFDISTLELLNTSHDVRTTVTGNAIEFAFREINLSPSLHGNILFKLKSRPHLRAGDEVGNQANIVFDYNRPLQTNNARTVFAALTRGGFDTDASVKMYPNPANGIVTIEASTPITTIQLYDVQGRILQIVNNATTLNVSARASGVYFVKITTDKGVKVEKLIKN